MATISQTNNGSEAAPDRDWYTELFRTGMFSDVTIRFYGGRAVSYHEQRVHSAVLSPKCEWFASCWKALDTEFQHSTEWKATNRTLDIDESLDEEVLEQLKDTEIKACYLHSNEESESCVQWIGFRSMLKFCYTSDYKKCVHSYHHSRQERVTVHVHMYLLGIIYGVKDILPRAVQGFQNEVKMLRYKDRNLVIKFINLICNLKLDDDDVLRTEAFKEAKLIADNTYAPIAQKLLLSETTKYIKELMPVAGTHLFEIGYRVPKPIDAIQKPSEGPTCFRCFGAIEAVSVQDNSNADQRLCQTCKRAFTRGLLQINYPNVVTNGYSIALWQCNSCSVKWTCEGTRTRALFLKKCTCCPIPGSKTDPNPQTEGWECGGCGTIWNTRSTLKRNNLTLVGCICCPIEQK